jgi:hypothetical protein
LFFSPKTRFPGYSDKGATEQIKRKLEELLARRINGDALTPALTRWLNSLRESDRSRLREWDWLDESWAITTERLDVLLVRFDRQ